MRLRVLAILGMVAMAAGPAVCKPAAEIAWLTDVPAAFKKAAAENKVLMICINARDTPGEPMEPAARGLREVVYKHPTIVETSKSFVCCYVTPDGSSDDYGELRLQFGIDGMIVSPQHIFASPKHKPGDKPLARKQYWPYGRGEAAVEALLGLMEKALAAYRVREGVPDAPPSDDPGDGPPAEKGPAPAQGAGDAARKEWINKMARMVRTAEKHAVRLEAIRALVENDLKGDCTSALVPLIQAFDESENALAVGDVVRALGIPGLEAAATPIHTVLDHKDDRVRGNAAVSLEYIGSASSVDPLIARTKREKNEHIANHLYRALGRCGVADDKAKKRLLSKAAAKKEDFPHYGPVIGLAYYKGDEKLARSLEKMVTRLGPEVMAGSHGKHPLLRAMILWCLGEIQDPKTTKFIRKRLIKPLDEEKKSWSKSHWMSLYDAVARKCDGQADMQGLIDSGVVNVLWYDRGRELLDEYRLGRPVDTFAPAGEFGRRPEDEEK